MLGSMGEIMLINSQIAFIVLANLHLHMIW